MNLVPELPATTFQRLLEELSTSLAPALTEPKQITLSWQTAQGEQRELSGWLSVPTQENLQQMLSHLLIQAALSAPISAMQLTLTPLPADLPAPRPFRYQAILTRPQHPLPERRFTWQPG